MTSTAASSCPPATPEERHDAAVARAIDARDYEGSMPWLPWSEGNVEALASYPVFVWIRADYDNTAVVLEQTLLDDPLVRRAFDRHQIVPLWFDWSRQPEPMTRWMHAHGVDHEPCALIFVNDEAHTAVGLGHSFEGPEHLVGLIEAALSASPTPRPPGIVAPD